MSCLRAILKEEEEEEEEWREREEEEEEEGGSAYHSRGAEEGVEKEGSRYGIPGTHIGYAAAGRSKESRAVSLHPQRSQARGRSRASCAAMLLRPARTPCSRLAA
eukprot:2801466-Rhodomonas_salina.2